MRVLLPPALVLVLATGAWSQVEFTPRIGFTFEHFGETFRISDDRDTVATVNDYGTVLGLTVKNRPVSPSRFRLDADVLLGKQTRRVRVDFDGRARFGNNTLQFEHDGLYRAFNVGGDYSLSSDYLQEYVRLTYERRLGKSTRLRLRDTIDGTWYRQPNQYNLSFVMHRPGADLRFQLGEMNEIRAGYQYGVRSVPDSTSLGYQRHTGDASVNLLFGWFASLDVYEQIERRQYQPGSARGSSWENRLDVRLEFGLSDRATLRLAHENEIARFDSPDELDFDFEWSRTGVQVEMHQSPRLDLSLMPVYAFLTSSTALGEEYTETGLELGSDWRLWSRSWINFTYEIGRRDYEISASAEVASLDFGSPGGDPTDQLLLDTAFSDYIYHRLTLLVTSEVGRGISVNLFANWQPEDHRVNRHDTNTRIVSGGVEYRF